jgi:hypothetical protein
VIGGPPNPLNLDHTHATAAEFLDDEVMRDGLANHGKRLGAILGRTHRLVNVLPAALPRNSIRVSDKMSRASLLEPGGS